MERNTLRETYESLFMELLERLGLRKSIHRKLAMAVGIQFAISVMQAGLPFAVSGTARTVLAGVLLLGAGVAVVNTLILVQKDVVDPLGRLTDTADRITQGDLEGTVPEPVADDEIGGLTESVASMQYSLETVAAQADALARQDFEDPALEAEVPGQFGAALSTMSTNITSHTHELETLTEELESRSASLEDLIDRFVEATAAAGEGDLTATIDGSDVSSDHARLIENYNELLDGLSDAVSDVQVAAERVSSATQEADEQVQAVADRSEDVATSVNEISEGASSQTTQLQEASDELSTLSATVQEIAASADTVAREAEEAAERTSAGRVSATEAAEELDAVVDRIESTVESVESLSEQVETVDETLGVVDEVAERTHMLALNASIEAARVGADGDGFAVVAGEIQDLASEARQAANRASERIGTLQAEATDTVESATEMRSRVDDGADTIEEALAAFDQIADAVDDVESSVMEISAATDQQASTSQEVAELVDDVAAISQETTAEAQTVAHAADEQADAAGHLAEILPDVSRTATELESLADEFVVHEPNDQSRATPSVATTD